MDSKEIGGQKVKKRERERERKRKKRKEKGLKKEGRRAIFWIFCRWFDHHKKG